MTRTGEYTDWKTKGDVSDADENTAKTTGRRIILFSIPRTMSNLFVHLFRTNSTLDINSYHFVCAYFYGPDRVTPRTRIKPKDSPPGAGERSTGTYQVAYDQLRRHVRIAEEQGKIPFMKEHSLFIADPKVIVKEIPGSFECATPQILDGDFEHETTRTNPTILPDGFLKTLSPIFTIRHPAKMIPSMWRMRTHIGMVNDGRAPADMSYRWSRLLFDWYRECYGNQGGFPVVVDADDLTDNPKGIAAAFCQVAGLDVGQARYSWDPVGSEAPELVKALFESSGVVKQVRPESGYSIEEEAGKWKEEFGEEDAKILVKYANDAMDDYEYLMQFRLKGVSKE